MVYRDDPELDPYEISFLPQFRKGRGRREPFVNAYGVVIGDHEYDSPNSPLNDWSIDTDPSIMAGDEWVHPYKDIGFTTEANRAWFERGNAPDPGFMMHPDKDAANSSLAAQPPTDEQAADKRQPEP
ncbi:DUF3905 domain-containing protein [Paenibacillus sp. NPDC058071]|uniref:DUF3905 domain-containing protein n=1 Tax=Paenibacillus sp. NPDC058071 TaxID=3346326 RepID=UPI0036DD412D